MNNLTDNEFLLWIAKRLVYKYKEDPYILNRIIGIIAKHRTIASICVENNHNTLSGIVSAMNTLISVQDSIKTHQLSLSSKLNLPNTEKQQPIEFGDIDVESIIRGI